MMNIHSIRYFLAAAALTGLMGTAATACSDDDDDFLPAPSFTTPSQVDAQGTFSGTFVRVQVGTTDTLRAEGTLTVVATDTLNRARITYESDDMAELAATAAFPANVAHADQGYTLFNKSGDIALLCRISDDQRISASFTKAVRTGRRTVRYNYTFEGRRQ